MSAFSESIPQSLPERAGGYSAHVELMLHIGGEQLPLAQVAPDRLYFAHPIALPSSRGMLVISVDGVADQTEITVLPGQGTARIFEYTVG